MVHSLRITLQMDINTTAPHFIALFHLSVHPFIPVPSFMTGLSADINQLR